MKGGLGGDIMSGLLRLHVGWLRTLSPLTLSLSKGGERAKPRPLINSLHFRQRPSKLIQLCHGHGSVAATGGLRRRGYFDGAA